jgi:hypothetical protein
MRADEQNDLITAQAGHAAGKLLRAHWQPAALSTNSTPRGRSRRAPLGEDFVLFRDEAGRYGSSTRLHRGADLAFGRLENGGLRLLRFPRLALRRGGPVPRDAAEPETSACARIVRGRTGP